MKYVSRLTCAEAFLFTSLGRDAKKEDIIESDSEKRETVSASP